MISKHIWSYSSPRRSPSSFAPICTCKTSEVSRTYQNSVFRQNCTFVHDTRALLFSVPVPLLRGWVACYIASVTRAYVLLCRTLCYVLCPMYIFNQFCALHCPRLTSELLGYHEPAPALISRGYSWNPIMDMKIGIKKPMLATRIGRRTRSREYHWSDLC